MSDQIRISAVWDPYKGYYTVSEPEADPNLKSLRGCDTDAFEAALKNRFKPDTSIILDYEFGDPVDLGPGTAPV